MATITWNPDDKSNYITLSNGNLTATTSGDSVIATVKATGDPKTSGKYYWEFVLDTVGDWVALGIAWPDMSNDDGIDETYTSFCYETYGGHMYYYYANGSNGGELDVSMAAVQGDTICFCHDIDAGYLWVGKKNGAAITWRNGGDPALGTDPDLENIRGAPYLPAITIWYQNNAISAHFSLEDMDCTIPDGFYAYNVVDVNFAQILKDGLEMAFSQVLKHSINVIVLKEQNLINSITQGMTLKQKLKDNIRGVADVSISQKLIDRIEDTSTGVTYGGFSFNKRHGL